MPDSNNNNPLPNVLPNLIVSDALVTDDNGNPIAGVPLIALDETINLSWTVQNTGAGVAEDFKSDGVYVSEDRVWDISDKWIQSPRTDSKSPLAAGASYTRLFNATIDENDNVAPGNYFLLFKADDNNEQEETDEADNTFAIPIEIDASNLEVSSAQVTKGTNPVTSVAVGESLEVSWTVQNTSARATAQVSGGWYDYVYLSQDAMLDDSDETLESGRRLTNQSLAAGDEYTFERDITIPEVTLGNYFLLFKADVNKDLTEANENDNTFAIPIEVVAPSSNNPPTITSNLTPNLNENTTLVTTVTATDPNGDNLNYGIAGGEDSNLFTINSTTGELSFNNAPNFESPLDTDGDNIYEVEVTADDGNGGVDTQTLNVAVNNVNESPTITSDSILNINENSTLVSTVTASDEDGDVVNYGIAGGADSNLFTINSTTGELSFNNNPNFESPLDADGDNVYEVEVSAADSNGGVDTQTLNITVNNLSETSVAETNLANLNGINGFVIDGESSTDFLNRVSDAGDVNGDGFDDIILGAPGASSSYVIFGKDTGFDANFDLSTLDGSNGFKINGENASDAFGISVSSAGDVNGDGIDDLIVGADGAAGSSYVVFGRTTGFTSDLDVVTLDSSNGFKINGEAEYDGFGSSVSSAGDVNGDGIDDLIIGADSADANGDFSGSSYVVFGSNTGFTSNLNLATLDGSNGFKINGEAAGDSLGRSVSSAGDFNGDGIDDFIVAAEGADPNGSFSGSSYVVFGKNTGFASSFDLTTLDGSNGFKLNGEAAGDSSGRSVSSAGDINNDGFDDIIIGAPFGGSSYIVFGNNTGFSPSLDLSTLDGNNGFKINEEAADDFIGFSVSGLGDFNGDGIDDIILGAVGSDSNGSGSGSSHVIFGSNDSFAPTFDLSTLDGSNGLKLNGAGAEDNSGYSVSGAGDINGDGFNDLIIGAMPGGSSYGRAYVVFSLAGNNAPTITSGTSFNLDENTTKITTVTATDPDGDALNFSITGGDDASLFAVDETTGELRFLNTPDFESPADADGDNLYEVEVTASDPKNGTDTQAINVTVNDVSETPLTPIEVSQFDGSNGFKINGELEGDRAGRNVSGIGDINGDGIDDFIVGAFGADPNGNNYAGSAYVVFGTDSGFNSPLELSSLDGSNGFKINGEFEFAGLGNSVSERRRY